MFKVNRTVPVGSCCNFIKWFFRLAIEYSVHPNSVAGNIAGHPRKIRITSRFGGIRKKHGFGEVVNKVDGVLSPILIW